MLMKEGLIWLMSNDEELIENLFSQYHDSLQHFCMFYFSYDLQYLPYVDDCIQEVFLSAYKKRMQLVVHPNPYAWLKNACKKQCMVMIRNEKSHEKILQEHFYENDIRDDILQWLIENDVKEQLNKLEAQLTDAKREIYEAYFIQNLSTQQIAETRKTTNAAVRGAIQRIRKKATQLPISLILLIMFYM